VWERDVLKDIPEVQDFGKKSSKDRGLDATTSKTMSIATGVIKRGRSKGVSDEDILTFLTSNWSDAESLKKAYLEDEQSDKSQSQASGPQKSGLPQSSQQSSSGSTPFSFGTDKSLIEKSTVARTIEASKETAAEDEARRQAQAQMDQEEQQLVPTEEKPNPDKDVHMNDSSNDIEEDEVLDMAKAKSPAPPPDVTGRSASASSSWASDCETTDDDGSHMSSSIVPETGKPVPGHKRKRARITRKEKRQRREARAASKKKFDDAAREFQAKFHHPNSDSDAIK
jgi:hypothetical protein